ncbi:MAG: serine hydrolase [Nannocystaceae bacterium]|nr:beta-lactamase family protein [bacterium]
MPAARPKAARPVQVDRRTAQLARAHVIRPKHIVGVETDKGVPARRRRVNLIAKTRRISLHPRLNIDTFGPALHAKLHEYVHGYAWQIRRKGTPMHTGLWGSANGSQGWSLDTRMHVASVSKLMTAMAMAHKLRGANRKVTDHIWDYLPEYWSLGARVKDIQFRHLLNHTAGFRVPGSATDFSTMKAEVAGGVQTTHGKYGYENVNFALCRILIPVMHGWIGKTDTHGTSTDHIWDVRSTIRFREYCNTHVFGPSGVSEVGFRPSAGEALAYDSHSTTSGWNSGDLQTVCGGAGFRMSVNDVLDVMGTFRRSGKILPQSEVQPFLDMMLGLDQRIDTAAGGLYNKNGAWGPGDGRLEQCVVYFMPDDMELCIFVNSPIAPKKAGGKVQSLRGLVKDAYVENLT